MDSRVPEHFEAASDVIFGRVMSGELVGYFGYSVSMGAGGRLVREHIPLHYVRMSFEIKDVLKGDAQKKRVALTHSLDPLQMSFELGMHYVLFLYRGDISWCGMAIPLSREVVSVEDGLKSVSKYLDDPSSIDAAELLDLLETGR